MPWCDPNVCGGRPCATLLPPSPPPRAVPFPPQPPSPPPHTGPYLEWVPGAVGAANPVLVTADAPEQLVCQAVSCWTSQGSRGMAVSQLDGHSQ